MLGSQINLEYGITHLDEDDFFYKGNKPVFRALKSFFTISNASHYSEGEYVRRRNLQFTHEEQIEFVHFEEHIHLLKQYSQLRQLIYLAKRMAKLAIDCGDPIEKVYSHKDKGRQKKYSYYKADI